MMKSDIKVDYLNEAERQRARQTERQTETR